MGAPIEYDTFGAMRQGQEIRQNQMTMQRRADAQAALNAMRQPMSPAMQPAPAMQPGSSGPPITGAPLPSVNAMGAGAPMPAAARAAPVNSARDMSTLYQFMDIPEVKNYVDEMNRQETARVTAAGRATDDTRLQSAADIQRGNYTNGLLQQGALNLIDDQSDEAIISNAARLAELPGVDVPMINASRDALLAMPPSQRATTVRRTAAIDTGASRAAGLTEPNLVARTDGASSWFEDMNRNSETFGQRFSPTAMQETPGQRRTQENRDVDRAAPDFRERNDGATRWLEDINPDSPTFGERRSARTIQPGPDGGRRSRDGPAPRPAQTAPRRRVYNPATGRVE
jgi:hypothetical protein